MSKLPKNFDHIFYADHYHDLKNAFGLDKTSLENHYLSNGRFENRKYCDLPEKFNWKTYLQTNSDHFTTIESITKNNVIDHFLNNSANIAEYNDKPIFILYYAYLNVEKDWRDMIKNQLYDMKKSGIMSVSMFHAVLLGTPDNIKEAKLLIETLLNRNVEITEIYNNLYEFPAIIKIRELAIIYPEKIFIYFHSKGMVNNNDSRYRTQVEQRLTLNTFLDWESTLYIFEKYSNIQKAALFPSINGFGWYNFWWATGSYLASCKPIEIPENLVDNDRFLCESWLGTNGSNTWEDCYSIVNKNISYSELPWDEIWTKT